MTGVPISDELKESIISYYKNNIVTIVDVCKKFNLCAPTISKILKGIKKYSKSELYNPQLNQNYFENIDSEDKAYYLGLIITDGNVYKDKGSGRQASISIYLSSPDEYLLEKFKQILKTNTSLVKDNRREKPGYSIAIRSDKIADDLSKLGIIPNKTFQTFLPQVQEEFMPALIRGILDGDGSIRFSKYKNKYLHYISFCGTHQLMVDISNYLYKTLKLNTKPNVYDYKNKGLSEIKITRYDDIIKVGDWIYTDSTIKMYRKYDKYTEIKQYVYNSLGDYDELCKN